ncbi:hypothetical protein K505DRAFT_358695 [Melanomma pulvis-pyrius CBS 109.77]|uniref:Uncharacterized protein n=1 Tax=Melanomma pulvis-pyrius CBS 109.77 TaxID=1314802 RepID=A0A6A6XL62_9PLEO|nr:hypothetical protein K505DRAFT_358695 [Melanomma pulvis-pyrius CBS 109.77]
MPKISSSKTYHSHRSVARNSRYARPSQLARSPSPHAEENLCSLVEPAPTSLYDAESEIKDICKTFRLVFNAACEENWQSVMKSCIKLDGTPEDNTTFYEIHEDRNVSKPSSLPDDVPDIVAQGYPHWNMCGIGCWMALEPLRRKLTRFDVTVDIIVLKPYPTILMVPPGRTEISDHCVLKIDLPCGKVFIADFTLQQFGYGETSWWCEMESYLEQFSATGNFRSANEDDLAVSRGWQGTVLMDIGGRQRRNTMNIFSIWIGKIWGK